MTKKINRIISCILVFAVVLVLANCFRGIKSPYEKYTARVGTYAISVTADALIAREEYVLAPNTSGIIEPVVSEGEKVSSYSRLGAVITGDIDPGKVSQLKSLNDKIDELNRTLSEAGILSIADDKVDATLDLSLEKLRYAAAKNDVGSAVMQSENVRILTQRKMGVTSSSIAHQELADAITLRDNIAATLGGSHTDLYAPVSGVYSGNVDGFETRLTADWAKAPAPESVEEMMAAQGSGEPQGLCKIINNYKWYAVANIADEECEGLNVGAEYAVKFKNLNENRLTGKVCYISPPDESGKRAVSIVFDNYIEDFTTIRQCRIEINKETYSGIYVPRSAIRVDNVQGVWVQNEVSLEFKSIVEVYRADDFILAEKDAEGQGGHKNLALYDSIVLNPDK